MTAITIIFDAFGRRQLKPLLFKPIKKDAESKDEKPLILGLYTTK